MAGFILQIDGKDTGLICGSKDEVSAMKTFIDIYNDDLQYVPMDSMSVKKLEQWDSSEYSGIVVKVYSRYGSDSGGYGEIKCDQTGDVLKYIPTNIYGRIGSFRTLGLNAEVLFDLWCGKPSNIRDCSKLIVKDNNRKLCLFHR